MLRAGGSALWHFWARTCISPKNTMALTDTYRKFGHFWHVGLCLISSSLLSSKNSVLFAHHPSPKFMGVLRGVRLPRLYLPPTMVLLLCYGGDSPIIHPCHCMRQHAHDTFSWTETPTFLKTRQEKANKTGIVVGLNFLACSGMIPFPLPICATPT